MLDKILKFEESDRSLFIFDTFVNTGQQWLGERTGVVSLLSPQSVTETEGSDRSNFQSKLGL